MLLSALFFLAVISPHRRLLAFPPDDDDDGDGERGSHVPVFIHMTEE
jgi:hypothetical protein